MISRIIKYIVKKSLTICAFISMMLLLALIIESEPLIIVTGVIGIVLVSIIIIYLYI